MSAGGSMSTPIDRATEELTRSYDGPGGPSNYFRGAAITDHLNGDPR